MQRKAGCLIGIEGIDAVGKKTQTTLLRSWFMRKNIETELVSFPDYTTHIGREIRAFLDGRREYPPELRHMLFSANRWEKLNHLRNSLSDGKFVIVNRYVESNLAYGMANGLSLEWLSSLERGLPKTDIVILLDAPPSLLFSRRNSKKDIYELDIRLQERVRSAYKKLARRFGWFVVRAVGDINTTHKSITSIISRELLSKIE